MIQPPPPRPDYARFDPTRIPGTDDAVFEDLLGRVLAQADTTGGGPLPPIDPASAVARILDPELAPAPVEPEEAPADEEPAEPEPEEPPGPLPIRDPLRRLVPTLVRPHLDTRLAPPVPVSPEEALPDPVPVEAEVVTPKADSLLGLLSMLPLRREERDALERVARDPATRPALLRLASMAGLTARLAEAEPGKAAELAAEISAARDSEVVQQAVRYLHNVPGEGALLEKLAAMANSLAVIAEPFQLAGTKPRLLGWVQSLSIWWYREWPGGSGKRRVPGTALEFVDSMLAWKRWPDRPEVVSFVWQIDVRHSDATEPVYVISRVVQGQDGRFRSDVPSSDADTAFRLVQGLLDAVLVVDHEGRERVIVDRLTWSPLLLTRNLVLNRGPGGSCPADTRLTEQELAAQGIRLLCDPGRAMWFLEPAWMAMGTGFTVLESPDPAAMPGTPAFLQQVERWREEARRRHQAEDLPRQRMLRSMLSGGAGALPPPVR